MNIVGIAIINYGFIDSGMISFIDNDFFYYPWLSAFIRPFILILHFRSLYEFCKRFMSTAVNTSIVVFIIFMFMISYTWAM